MGFVEEDITANSVEIENDIEVYQEVERCSVDLDELPDLSEVEPNTEETKQEVIEEDIGANAVDIENDIETVDQEGGRYPADLEKNSNIPNDNENEPTSEETCDDNKVEPTSSEESCILSSAIGKDEAEPGMKVEVAGTWTAIPWLPIPCELSLDGLWEKELNLGKGVYEYKFLVNGNWFFNPSKPTVRQQNGITNNILTVEGTHNGNDKFLEEENEVSRQEICIDKAWSDEIEKGYEDVNKVSGEEIEIDIEKGVEIEIRKTLSDKTEKGLNEDLLATGEATGVQDEDLSKECIAADTLINAIYEAEGRQEEVKSKLKDKSEQESCLNNERDEKTTQEFCSDFAAMIKTNEFAQNDGSLDRQCRSLFAESIIQSSNLFKFLDEKFATNQKDDTVSGGKYLKEDSNSKVESRIEKENKQGGDQEASSIAKEDDKNAFENEGSKIKWEWKALERGDYVEIFEEAVSSEDKEGHTEGSKEDCAELSEETILFVDKEGHSEESKDIKREECTELLEENVMSVEEENHSEDSKDIEKEDCSELHFEDIVSSVDKEDYTEEPKGMNREDCTELHYEDIVSAVNPQTTRDPHVEEIVSAVNLQTTRDPHVGEIVSAVNLQTTREPHVEEIVSAINLQTTRDPHVEDIISAVNLQTTRDPHVEEIVSAVNHQITRDTNFEEIVSAVNHQI